VRWTQLGAFTPLFRNHSNKGTRAQEPYAFGDETLRLARNAIRLRYSLLWYAYSEYLTAVRERTPFIRPLVLDFRSQRTRRIEDQFLFGRSLMVAPVHEQGARGRYVHLPEQRWLHWPASSETRAHCAVMDPGDYFVPADLGTIPLFLREDRLITVQPPQQYLGERPVRQLSAVGLVADEAALEIVLDDGKSAEWFDERWARITLQARRTSRGFEVNASRRGDSPFVRELGEVNFELYDRNGIAHHLTAKIELAR
jgi:alpha-glucosidase